MKYQEINEKLDERIKNLQQELNELKRARRARARKARKRDFIARIPIAG